MVKNGRSRQGRQQWLCRVCGRTYGEKSERRVAAERWAAVLAQYLAGKPDSPDIKPSIVYGPVVIDGVPTEPDARAAIECAYKGHPILVSRVQDYDYLRNVYVRKNAKLPQEEKRRFFRRQIGPSSWRLIIAKSKEELPRVQLEQNYDPKRGQYRRYAEQLAAGITLSFESKYLAKKARLAWQKYTPRESRQNLRASVYWINYAPPLYGVKIFPRQEYSPRRD